MRQKMLPKEPKGLQSLEESIDFQIYNRAINSFKNLNEDNKIKFKIIRKTKKSKTRRNT